jgi:hypothetical protein
VTRLRAQAFGIAAVLVVAVAAVLVPMWSDDGPGAGEARLEVEGEAVVERRDGERDIVRGSTDLVAGDRVEVTAGVGRLLLSGGTRMELRAGLGDAGDSMLLMGEVPELEAGDVLVAAPETATVEAAGTSVHVAGGAAQVSRALGVGVRSYDGTTALDSAGQERAVPALREMLVPALGRPPQAPRPLDYEAADPWDRRFLGDAMALGERLEALAEGYTQNLNPGEGRTPGFFRLVLPGLDDEPEFSGALIDIARPPGETLIGAAISELGRKGEFAARWSSVFGFRDQGAAWGLVALDQAVNGTPLVGSIEQAVSASPLGFAAPASTSPTPAAPTDPAATPQGAGAALPTSTTTTTRPSGSPTTAPPPTEAPPITVAPVPQSPLTPVLEPVVEPVVAVVGGLVNGLLGLLPPPPPG